ncbi:hypothetical protein [Thiocystis violacea]|uniref:hypothetical protein n=1 Tax=Thiocystis violacea TaxID=13725 RepID=UPI001A90D5B3|nr:hypothetical protein [Thiocystis violacea]
MLTTEILVRDGRIQGFKSASSSAVAICGIRSKVASSQASTCVDAVDKAMDGDKR